MRKWIGVGGPCPTDALLLRASAFQSALKHALADQYFLEEGGAIGYNCRHLYEESALSQADAKLAAGGQGLQLFRSLA